MAAKKIVYLVGAGAIQAEMDFGGIESDITMAGISRNVYKMSESVNGKYCKLVQDFALLPDHDVELMMSLFEGFTNLYESEFYEIYDELRVLFRKYLLSQITQKGIEPRLLSTLLHINKKYGKYMGESGEKMLGVLTTNYDSLLEEALSDVFNGLNCGYKFKSNNYNMVDSIPPLLKLHGSFNWKIHGIELEISKDFENIESEEKHQGWIPPSVYKKPPEEIFPKIWGKARELLIDCDILRVVGSSLRNEDLTLLSLIFTSQITSKPPFNIELIVPERSVLGSENSPGIMGRLPFLTNISSVRSLSLFDQEELFGDNVFLHWLLKKIEEAENKNTEVTSDSFIKEKIEEEG